MAAYFAIPPFEIMPLFKSWNESTAMWEAMMMLRLIASVSPKWPLGRRAGHAATPAVLPADTLKGAIRLDFAAWRLSLPASRQPNGHGHHDRKIA